MVQQVLGRDNSGTAECEHVRTGVTRRICVTPIRAFPSFAENEL